MDDPFDAMAAAAGRRGPQWDDGVAKRVSAIAQRLRHGALDGLPAGGGIGAEQGGRGVRGLGLSAVAIVAALGLGAWWVSAGRAPPVELPRAGGSPAAQPAEVVTTPTDEPTSAEVSAAGGGGQAGEHQVAESSSEVVVHVAGQVAKPGLYRVPSGGRVADALTLAGGASGTADLDRLNLAEPLVDGARVYVPALGQADPPATVGQQGGVGAAAGPPAAGPSGSPDAPDSLVNLNTADAAALEELPGVGPVTAEAIVAHRGEAGPFTQVEELLEVRGIGDAKLEAMADLVTVG